MQLERSEGEVELCQPQHHGGHPALQPTQVVHLQLADSVLVNHGAELRQRLQAPQLQREPHVVPQHDVRRVLDPENLDVHVHGQSDGARLAHHHRVEQRVRRRHLQQIHGAKRVQVGGREVLDLHVQVPERGQAVSCLHEGVLLVQRPFHPALGSCGARHHFIQPFYAQELIQSPGHQLYLAARVLLKVVVGRRAWRRAVLRAVSVGLVVDVVVEGVIDRCSQHRLRHRRRRLHQLVLKHLHRCVHHVVC
mmetsp:Transcript_25420/g.48008  ORF Transcript_25420/g.48008 Transcript_25420/m.48008 type:complete len:250 (-) Transcript_25420:205-954(-)